jgi:hypothetical protein
MCIQLKQKTNLKPALEDVLGDGDGPVEDSCHAASEESPENTDLNHFKEFFSKKIH